MSKHMFSWRNKKDISIFRMKKAPYLLLWVVVRYETSDAHTKKNHNRGTALEESVGTICMKP